MMKSCIGACVAVVVSVAVMAPTGSVSADQAQAAGGLYTGDCPQAIANANQLEQGLGAWEAKIAKAQGQLDDLKKSGGHQGRDAQKGIKEAQKDLALDATSMLAKLDVFKQALQKAAQTAPKSKAVSVLAALSDLEKIETAYKGVKITIAAGKWSLAMQDATAAMERVGAFARFLDDAGVTGELAGMAAATAGIAGSGAGAAVLASGVGALAVAAGVLAIDTVIADEDAFQNVLDQNRAADAVNQLRHDRNMFQDKISAVRARCMPQRTNQAKPAQQSSPVAAPPPAASDGGGPSVGKVLAMTTAIGGLAAGAVVLVPMIVESTSAPDCSAQLTVLNNTANSMVNVANSCNGGSLSCLQTLGSRVTTAAGTMVTAAGNVCSCMGATPVDAATRSELSDLFSQLRAAGFSPGSLPGCFR